MIKVPGSILSALIVLMYAIPVFAQSDEAETRDLDRALQQKNFLKAAEISFDFGRRSWQEQQPELAKKHFIQSLTYAKRTDSAVPSLKAASSLAAINFETGDFNNAADYYHRSAELAKSLALTDDVITYYIREAESFARLKRFKKAVSPVELAVALAIARGAIKEQIRCYEMLEEYYTRSGNTRKAGEAASLRRNLQTLQENEARAREKATLLEEQAQQALEQMEQNENVLIEQTERLKMTEETLKVVEELNRERQLEIGLLNKEKEISQLRIEEQNARLENEALVRNSILIVILLSSSLAAVMIVNYRRQIRTNRKIDLQNKNIKSSINYAKRIQEAMLPTREFQQSLLGNSFIYFKPRDVVSGDFYWFSPLVSNADDLVFAAIDCTGHGVPGAFMSMIGFNSLNNIINHGANEPNLILENLHKRIRNALQQDVTGNNDGMDVALCIYRKKKNILEFSGAKNSLVYIRENELTQIKGDVHSIGGSRSKADQRFKKHAVQIDKPTMVYLFTDGYRDQFGGDDKQKFMSKRFSKLLLDIHQLPVDEQLHALDQTFNSWKSGNDQTDDVLVIGVRLEPE